MFITSSYSLSSVGPVTSFISDIGYLCEFALFYHAGGGGGKAEKCINFINVYNQFVDLLIFLYCLLFLSLIFALYFHSSVYSGFSLLFSLSGQDHCAHSFLILQLIPHHMYCSIVSSSIWDSPPLSFIWESVFWPFWSLYPFWHPLFKHSPRNVRNPRLSHYTTFLYFVNPNGQGLTLYLI